MTSEPPIFKLRGTTHVAREQGSLSRPTLPHVRATSYKLSTTIWQKRDRQENEEGFPPQKKKQGQKKAENGENVELSHARNVWNAVLAIQPGGG